MLRVQLIISLGGLLLAGTMAGEDSNAAMKFGMVIHGGAGTIDRAKMTPEREKAHRERSVISESQLRFARRSASMRSGGNCILEDNPLFAAAAPSAHEGTNELDSSIMDEQTGGAVRIEAHNPISLARMVMEKSPHVMLQGEGAEAFARKMGMPFVDQKYFYTEERWKALQEIKSSPSPSPMSDKDKHGTVGAVALDQTGNLAAGTSTGGITNKQFGRVGDSPIIGAGTYETTRPAPFPAATVGFIRATSVAHNISTMMGYEDLPVAEAAQRALR
jgi:beta-aspartyl-peptidase (threonine type)